MTLTCARAARVALRADGSHDQRQLPNPIDHRVRTLPPAVHRGTIRVDRAVAGEREVAVSGSVVPAGEVLEVRWAAI